jgi:dTDP-4-dehydrorhamnose 3,5-epimerase
LAVTSPLPEGVEYVPLTPHQDDRGVFTEVFRAEWPGLPQPVQWNLVRSRAAVFRGVHVHFRHADYLIIVSGRMRIGLRDLRPGAPTEGLATAVDLVAEEPAGLVIPPGVAHGFYFEGPAIHAYAVTHYWDLEDELGCHWRDPDLEIAWDIPDSHLAEVRLSSRDASLPALRELAGRIPRWRPAETPATA